jgi:uncharacterized protein YutE (UPF0331/DUF86 family)
MSPVDHEVVRRKLAALLNALAALEQSDSIDLDAYRRDFWRRKGTERVLQEMIEAGIDLAVRLLVQLGRPEPSSGRAAFLDLGSVAVISPELAQALAPTVELRNHLIHEYDKIDHNAVLGAVSQAQALFPRFIQEIEGFLGRSA